MKLRAIELTNVRRFAARRASLTGIGDGITVLSEPNEFGKSTFFDALHALFFEKHRSTRSAVKALQPHAGGAPEVTVEVDLPEGRFRIAKRWLQRPHARITDATGRLIAQEDEAEAWIDRLMGGDLAGPSGLLWVRQGLLGIEPEGTSTADKQNRERGLTARRDLFSSVAGEIDMMTGGRRMDAVVDRVAEALQLLATTTGRPRAGGDWARAVDEAARLAAEEDGLRPRAARLSGDLARRTEVQRSLSRVTDPQDMAARADSLARAEAAHRAALAHQDRIAQAQTALRVATLDAETVTREAAQLDVLALRVEQARAALQQAQTRAESAHIRAEDLAQRDRDASAAVDVAGAVTRDLRARLARADRARTALAARAQASELQRRLTRASDLQTTLDTSRGQRARLRLTGKALAAAEAAQAALDLAHIRAEAQAVTVLAQPDGTARASIAGRFLPDRPHPILSATDIDLPGFGRLRVDPGAIRGSDSAADTARATEALERALVACDADSLAAARAAWLQAQTLDASIAQAAALLVEVAPDGTDALRSALARATAEAADAPTDSPEDIGSLTHALAAAERAEAEARATAKTSHDLAARAGEARAAAQADYITATRHLATAEAEAGDPATRASRTVALRTRLPELAETRNQATAALATLQADAPDPVTADANLARAKSARDQADRDIARAREELASLNATIAAYADEGIEERLSTLAGARAEAEARAARYEAEVRALTRLRHALDAARAAARDAYFDPVLRELQPLLAILYPGARLSIDDQTLLPAILTRDGQDEPLDILSGGTREQLAILTRLAFARLFAAAGRPVPLLLDDALVHSDDDRIEAMFTALHRVARDQQIVVFTCRQRAFAALGGDRAAILIDAI